MGLSFTSEHTQSLGSCRSAAALAVLEESVPRARLPWMSMTYWMGIQWNAKQEKFLHPPTKPVLQLAVCVWGGKGDFRNPSHTLRKGIRSRWGETKQSNGKFCFCFYSLDSSEV